MEKVSTKSLERKVKSFGGAISRGLKRTTLRAFESNIQYLKDVLAAKESFGPESAKSVAKSIIAADDMFYDVRGQLTTAIHLFFNVCRLHETELPVTMCVTLCEIQNRLRRFQS
jgi:hypothetical protein